MPATEQNTKTARGPQRTLRMPPFRAVQLARLVDHVPAGNNWLHEMKLGGYRCLIAVGGGKAKAYTRSGLDWSDKFRPLVVAAATLKVGSALIDGEAVVLDARGKSNFQSLQATLKGGRAAPSVPACMMGSIIRTRN